MIIQHVRNLGTPLDRMFNDPDSILPPTPDVPPPAPRPTNPRDIVCQFCESRLATNGQVLRMSERAEALRDFEDDAKEAARDLAQARTEIDALTTKLNAAERDAAALRAKYEGKKGFWT
jgi:hypothetical protein